MLEIILKNREDCLLKSYRDEHATCKGIRPTGHIWYYEAFSGACKWRNHVACKL